MTRYFFGKAAAQALIGQRVKNLKDFRGVPHGTTGRVVRADPTPTGDGDRYEVGIEWDLPYSGKPPVDRFSRDEYYTNLEEVLGQGVGV